MLVVTSLLFGVGACATEPRERGVVVVKDGLPAAAARVQLSYRWPASTLTRALDGGGAFAVPTGYGAAVAFVDVDGNGGFEPFREPSAHCGRERDQWHCTIGRTRVIAHRVSSGTVEDDGEPVHDNIELRVERYLADGRPDDVAEACVRGELDLCAHVGADALGPATNPATAVSPCQLDGRLPEGESIPVTMTASDATLELDVPYPPALRASVRVDRSPDRISIIANADMPITNAIVWFGEMDANTVYWSTEQEPGALRIDAREVHASVPRSVLATCSTCKLMVQLANVAEGVDVGTFSEARFVITTERT
jgi:hypothetical protein